MNILLSASLILELGLYLQIAYDNAEKPLADFSGYNRKFLVISLISLKQILMSIEILIRQRIAHFANGQKWNCLLNIFYYS